jgi:hypothetical protein
MSRYAGPPKVVFSKLRGGNGVLEKSLNEVVTLIADFDAAVKMHPPPVIRSQAFAYTYYLPARRLQ